MIRSQKKQGKCFLLSYFLIDQKTSSNAQPGPLQKSQMESFMTIVNCLKLSILFGVVSATPLLYFSNQFSLKQFSDLLKVH